MAFKPFVLPSGTDFYAGDGAPSGVADPLFIVVDSTNKVGINSQTPSGTLDINTASSGDKGLIIRASTSQTANLIELQNVSSGIIYYVSPSSQQSGISAIYSSGIQLLSGVPASTANTLYSSGNSLYWNGTGINVGPVTLSGGASGYLTIWSSASGISYSNSLKFDSANNRVVFTGTGISASGMNMNILSDSTISFESTAGQLFSISDGLASGTIFSVNDISGMSSIEVDASGLIKFGEYDGFIGIGTSQTFGQYSGKVEIAAPSGYKTLVLRPASGSTSNILETQNYSSGTLTIIDASGRMHIGGTGSLNQLEVDTLSTTTKGIVVKGQTSQSANLIEWSNPSITFGAIDSAGKLGIGTSSPTGTVDITAVTGSTKGLILRANNTQSVNVFEIDTGAGSPLFIVDSGGAVSGITATIASGITLSTGVPAVTTNKLYNSGSYLQFNGGYVSGVTVNPLTYNSGITGTTANFNGSATTNISLGGSGNLTNLVVSSGITLTAGIPAVTTNNNLYASGNTLWFNGFPVSGGPMGPSGAGGALGYYGSFYDITNQTYPSTTGVVILGLGQVSEAKGVSISGGNAVLFNYPGTYSLTYSIQFLNGAIQLQDVDVWLRKNGVDVSGSNTIFTVPGSHFTGVSGALAGSCNYVYTYNSGDYIQLASASNSTSVVVSYIPSQTSPTVPSAPSIIFTAQQVMNNQFITGIVPIASGGTNLSTAPSNGQLLIGSGTSYALNTLTAGSGISVTNGSGSITVSMGGTGNLNQLIFSTGTIIGDINTGSGRISPATTDIFIGNSAGNSASGTLPIFIGPTAGNSASGTSNIFIGNSAGASFPGNYNTAIGFQAANNANGVAVSGSYNTVAGYRAFRNSSGTYNVCIGYGAGGEDSNSTYDYNTALGYQAGYQASGSYNVNIGYNAGFRVYGTGNIEIRTRNTNPPLYGNANSSNKLNIGETIVGDMLSKKIYIGDGSTSGNFSPNATLQVQAKSATDKVFIAQATTSQSANILEVQDSFGTALISIDTLGRVSQNIAGSGTNWGNVAFGPSALGSMTQAGATNLSYNTAIGSNAMANATGCTANTCIGWYAGSAITTGSANIIIGKTAGAAVTTQSYNTIIGDRAGQYITGGGAVAYGCLALATVSTGGDNVGIGFQAGNNITTGAGNTAIGNYSMLSSTTGVMSYNTAIGTNALRYNNASYNTALGYQALYLSSGLNANYNTALGIYAGYTVTTGSGNIFVGSSADVASGSGAINGAIVIGYGAQANQNSQLVIGSSTAKVGKSDGTGEQSTSSTAPSGITKLLETRINGTSYQIPLMPVTATDLQIFNAITTSGGITVNSGVPGTTTSKIYASGTALYWNGQPVSTGGLSGGSSGNVPVWTSATTQTYVAGFTYDITNKLLSNTKGLSSAEVYGAGAGINLTSANNATIIGNGALQGVLNSTDATFIGYSAGYQSANVADTGVRLTFVGSRAGQEVQTVGHSPTDSVGLGAYAGYGSYNVCNTFIGSWAGSNMPSGGGNIALGAKALSYGNQFDFHANGNGSGNIEITARDYHHSGVYPIDSSNSFKLNIGGTIRGDLSTKQIAIGNGTVTPTATLDVISNSSSRKGLIVKGAASQSANYLEVQNASGTALLAITSSGAISGAITPTIITSTGGITLDDTYNGYIIEQTGVAGSGTFTLGSGTITIPGWNCSIVNIGSGVIIASGVNTMRSPGGLYKSRTQYSTISIYRRGAGDFVLGGDLA